uniref:Nitrogen assimilation transcription factor 4 n=1 Tax=Phaffia rhodozyma TaxID=264483 RepID=A0A1I9Q727_PHARH|nr:nitrogen assimilation transcription factor 4 [Phaffia rhodozyma]
MLPSSPSGNLTPPSIEVNYLPIQLDHQLHRHIIDLAFSRTLGYGSFAREVDFKTDLGASPLLRTSNYTPFVHLAVLAIGCRYLSPDKHHLVCPPGVDYEQRGQIFAEAAQEMVQRDGAEPDLAFIRGVTVSVFSLHCQVIWL